jgi:hypothetical protein
MNSDQVGEGLALTEFGLEKATAPRSAFPPTRQIRLLGQPMARQDSISLLKPTVAAARRQHRFAAPPNLTIGYRVIPT